MRTISLFLLLCLGCSDILLAEEPAPMVEVRGFSYEQPVTGVCVRQGKEYLPIELKAYDLGSARQLQPENSELSFYRAASGEGVGNQKKSWQKVGSIRVPVQTRSLVLAFIPQSAAQEGETYRILAFESDEHVFPAGAVRVINMSPFPVAVGLGDKNEILTPTQVCTISPALDPKNRVHAQFAVQLNAKDGWRRFSQGPLSLGPRQRATYLVAYSASVLVARGQDFAKTADGHPAPDMVLVSWVDYLRQQPVAAVQ